MGYKFDATGRIFQFRWRKRELERMNSKEYIVIKIFK
jgi:hypothetical protein